MNRYEKYNINLLFVLLFLLTACSDWLDVDLVNEEEERKLFQTEQGFHEALAGVYSKMSKSEMYGATLTFGGVDVLGQVYDFSNMLTGYKLCPAIITRNRKLKIGLKVFGLMAIIP
ncbi:MAG: hypothetical protein V8S95_06805 [Odoribacter sp.]